MLSFYPQFWTKAFDFKGRTKRIDFWRIIIANLFWRFFSLNLLRFIFILFLLSHQYALDFPWICAGYVIQGSNGSGSLLFWYQLLVLFGCFGFNASHLLLLLLKRQLFKLFHCIFSGDFLYYFYINEQWFHCSRIIASANLAPLQNATAPTPFIVCPVSVLMVSTHPLNFLALSASGAIWIAKYTTENDARIG